MTEARTAPHNRTEDAKQTSAAPIHASGTTNRSSAETPTGAAADSTSVTSAPNVRHHTPPPVPLPPGASYHPATDAQGAYIQLRDGSRRFIDTDDGYQGVQDVCASACGLQRIRLTEVKPAPKNLPEEKRKLIEAERLEAICTGRAVTFGHEHIGDREVRRRYGISRGATVPRSTGAGKAAG